MTYYHAVLIGEDGMEFGAGVDAMDMGEASEKLGENYPESRIVQLEGPEETAAREAETYDLIRRGADFDEDGFPFFPNGDLDEDYDDYDEDYLAENCLN